MAVLQATHGLETNNMANKKISTLGAAGTPLAGTEVLPIVQSGITVNVSVSNLTAGRTVSAAGVSITGTFTTTNATPVTAGSVGANPGTTAIFDGSGNLYKLASSARYKENIADWNVTNAQLDAFVNLSPKLWDYTGKQNGCAGFIAEDIEALGLKNAYNTSPLINYSNEGEPDSNRDFALIALQHKVIQRLDKAVQELKAEFDAYKASHP